MELANAVRVPASVLANRPTALRAAHVETLGRQQFATPRQISFIDEHLAPASIRPEGLGVRDVRRDVSAADSFRAQEAAERFRLTFVRDDGQPNGVRHEGNYRCAE